MEDKGNDREALISRIEQLEQERDKLCNDIEQLCLQQTEPSYSSLATRLHAQRTTGLEQEIENLKKKLAVCARENKNLQEELTEVYHIKGQFADLHNSEASKNKEIEKQLKFLQGCVTSAFAERDMALVEAETAKEQEEALCGKLLDLQNRIKGLEEENCRMVQVNSALQNELAELKEQNETFEKVIDKMYEIRQSTREEPGYTEWRDKCNCLLGDPFETWSFGDHDKQCSNYVISIEKELEASQCIAKDLESKLQMGLEIEAYLRSRNCEVEKRHKRSSAMIYNSLKLLTNSYAQFRGEIIKLLDKEKCSFALMISSLEEKIEKHSIVGCQIDAQASSKNTEEVECRDVHISCDIDPCSTDAIYEQQKSLESSVLDVRSGKASGALAQALEEKVAALLLLSQQEERHLLEREIHAALKRKLDELQRKLLQVTHEKVKALMEVAHLQQEYQLLKESIGKGVKVGNVAVEYSDDTNNPGREKIKSLFNRSYIKRWMGQSTSEDAMNDVVGHVASKRHNYPSDYVRLTIKNATLQESLTSIEHLTSSIHRLRLSLMQAKEAETSSTHLSVVKAADSIITEARLVKTALGTSLPISWPAGSDGSSPELGNSSIHKEESATQKVDTISAAGFEMVELLLFAAELLLERHTIQ